MVFWQLTIDAKDPAVLARFWAQALDYRPAPPAVPETTWHAHYRARLGENAAFDDRLFDPAGLRPPLWFQQVPEAKAGKNRLHLDLYPTGRDTALPMQRRIEIVEAKVAELLRLGSQRCRDQGGVGRVFDQAAVDLGERRLPIAEHRAGAGHREVARSADVISLDHGSMERFARQRLV